MRRRTATEANRLHPDGQGDVTELYGLVGTLAAQAVDNFDFRNVPAALPFRTNFISHWGAATNTLDGDSSWAMPGAPVRPP